MNHRGNLKQTDVAEKMGIRQGDLSKIEKKGDCNLSTFKKYLEACDKRMVVIKKDD